MLEGIDASSIISAQATIAAGKAFAYLKATDGTGTLSKAMLPNANALRGEGLGEALGAYHFLRVRHGRAQDADEQCKEFMDARANAGCLLSPMLDIELDENGGSVSNKWATKDEVKAAVILWLDTWAASSSQTVIIYSSPGEANAMGLTLLDELAAYPLACADYEASVHVPAPWTGPPSFWQYDGNVPACGGIVDLLRFNGDLSQLKTL